MPDFLTQLITWELGLLILAAHATGTAVKRVVTHLFPRYVADKRVKATIPFLVGIQTVLLCVYVVAPPVLTTTAMRVVYGLAIGSLWPHIVRMARKYSERFREIDDSIAGRKPTE